MALNTPFHLQRRDLCDERHLIHAPVARRAAHALRNMDRVIEIDEVRQIVNARPMDGNAGLPALAHRFEIGRRRE